MIRKNKNEEKTSLIIFAREPKDGKVKTRLSKDLPVPTVTKLYKAFVKDILNIAGQVQCDQRYIFYAGSGAFMPFLRKAEDQFRLKRQNGKDLGERMYRAFRFCQKEQFNRIVIIGTDCVTLTKQDIEKAFMKLRSYDCILGPSRDGGYYLIALKSPFFKLFHGIQWSTSSVLEQTIQRARAYDKKIFLLRKREDIDTFIHLKKLATIIKKSKVAPNTQMILSKSLKEKI